MKLMKFRQSAINQFLKCPRQFMFRHIEGIITPPKSALTLGSSLDIAETTNFDQKIESKIDLKTSDVLDIYSTEFDKRSPETEWDSDKDTCKDQGIKMLEVFHTVAAPTIQPATVQETFDLETDQGFSVTGTFDLTDTDGNIRDIKTSKAEYDTDAVSQSVQASMYWFAYESTRGQKPKGFIFDVITKHKTPRYQQIAGQVSSNQLSRLFETIQIMDRQIKAGDFQYSADGAWWCSKDWCGFWHLCKGKK